jgi:flagellar protein FlbD
VRGEALSLAPEQKNGPMIAVTRLNGSRFAVNPDLIERVQENPDTTLVMVGGATYVVRESLAEIIGLIADYRALVLATARGLTVGQGQQLSLVRGTEENDPDLGATPLRPTQR